MSVSITTGVKSILQLGVSLSDIALLFAIGRKYGNFLRAAKNEAELFESLMEEPQAILKRRGLVERSRLESRWTKISFMYQGQHVSNSDQPAVASKHELTTLSWLMVTVTAGLDVCLDAKRFQSLVIQVFGQSLDGNEDVIDSLTIGLPAVIESWRDVAAVREIAQFAAYRFKRYRLQLLRKIGAPSSEAIPHLNAAEYDEARQLLLWLLSSEVSGNTDFTCFSATMFAFVQTIEACGILISTGETRKYETQPLVHYSENVNEPQSRHLPSEYSDPMNLSKGIGTIAQVISYPIGKPEAMIDTIGVPRSIIAKMVICWRLGEKAAESFVFSASAQYPYSPSSEISYTVTNDDPVTSRFAGNLSALATHAFPDMSEAILQGLEEVLEGSDAHRVEWLTMYTAPEFLLKTQSLLANKRPMDMNIWSKYQALVFGFYYKLFEQLVSFAHVRDDTFLRGLWGFGSTTALAACSQFGQTLRHSRIASRTHVLYMLSMMYGGRMKIHSTNSAGTGLVGIRGPVSILARSLLKVSDIPAEISRFAIVTLPIIDLASDANGEMFAEAGCQIEFEHPPAQPRDIEPHRPNVQWSVHTKIGAVFGEIQESVVMVARCGDGRLVGWFSPLAADVAFLSDAYQHRQEDGSGDSTDTVVRGFEVADAHWARGCAPRPSPEHNAENTFGVIHSRDCAALRYAAAGFYMGASEEVAIATNNIEAALGRLELQGAGVIIA